MQVLMGDKESTLPGLKMAKKVGQLNPITRTFSLTYFLNEYLVFPFLSEMSSIFSSDSSFFNIGTIRLDTVKSITHHHG